MGRKRIYENDADRLAAYRARNARLDLTVDPELSDTLEQLSIRFGVSKNEFCVAVLKFGLTNRNWKALGMTHQKAP